MPLLRDLLSVESLDKTFSGGELLPCRLQGEAVAAQNAKTSAVKPARPEHAGRGRDVGPLGSIEVRDTQSPSGLGCRAPSQGLAHSDDQRESIQVWEQELVSQEFNKLLSARN